jgi:hypothetical protein
MTSPRPGRSNAVQLALSILLFLVVMVVLLAALGGAMGILELAIWLGVLVAGMWLMVRASRRRAG